MQEVLNQINELKDKLNSEKQEPEFFKDIREYAYSLITKKKLTKEEILSFRTLLGDDKWNINRKYEITDLIDVQSGSGGTEDNILEFSELYDNETVYADYVFNSLKDTTDFFVLLNFCLLQDGAFIIFEEDLNNNSCYISQLKDFPFGFALILVVGENLDVSVTESKMYKVEENNIVSGGIHRVVVRENSRLSYVYINNKEKGNSTNSKEFFIHDDSSVKLFTANFGGNKVRDLWIGNLLGKNSKWIHKGIYYAKNDQDFRFFYGSHHYSEKSNSEILIKGICDQDSKVDLIGDIFASDDSSQGSASFNEHGLLVGKNSNKKSLPVLRISTNDLIATHGSSTVQLNEEKEFYIQSRGISSQESQHMLIKGFLIDVLNTIKDEESFSFIENMIDTKMN